MRSCARWWPKPARRLFSGGPTRSTVANGEIGVVVKRGVKAHSPRVAALRRPDGGFHQQPVLRDTSQLRLAVTRGMTLANVKVHANHVRILAL